MTRTTFLGFTVPSDLTSKIAAIMKRRFLKQSREKIALKKPVRMNTICAGSLGIALKVNIGFGARCEVGWVGLKLC